MYRKSRGRGRRSTFTDGTTQAIECYSQITRISTSNGRACVSGGRGRRMRGGDSRCSGGWTSSGRSPSGGVGWGRCGHSTALISCKHKLQSFNKQGTYLSSVFNFVSSITYKF